MKPPFSYGFPMGFPTGDAYIELEAMKMIMAGAPELSWIAMIGKIRRTHGLEWCMYMHIYIYVYIYIYIYIVCKSANEWFVKGL